MVLGALRGIGKLIANKNGVKVFREIAENGDIITRSFRNGTPFKTITKHNVNTSETLFGTLPRELKGHITTVVNHETGIKTTINKKQVNYLKGFSQYNTYFRPGIRNEFSVERSMRGPDGNVFSVGNSYRRISAPNFLAEHRLRFDNGLLTFNKSTIRHGDIFDRYISAYNFIMPNGRLVNFNGGLEVSYSNLAKEYVKHFYK